MGCTGVQVAGREATAVWLVTLTRKGFGCHGSRILAEVFLLEPHMQNILIPYFLQATGRVWGAGFTVQISRRELGVWGFGMPAALGRFKVPDSFSNLLDFACLSTACRKFQDRSLRFWKLSGAH